MAGIVEQLELDTGPALRSVADVERALITAAGSFSSAVSEAIDEAAGKPVVLEGDATAVGSSIEESVSSADTAVSIEDVEAGQVASSIEESVSSADTLVVVEGDASQLATELGAVAEAAGQELTENIQQGLDNVDPSAIEGLGGALGEAGTESDGLSNKLSGLGVITTAATGGVKNLTGAVGKLGGPVGVGAAAVVTAGAVAINKMANEAEEAYLATQRFNATFGESAQIIERIDIGGLNTSLSELALNLGSDDDAIRNAASSLGVLADAAGASEGETAEYVKTVIALTAQLVAANPALGSIGENLGPVSLALSGNARAGRQFGIALTESQVAAEALAVSAGKTKDQLTLYDKSAAGARIRSKELGDTISQDVNKALEDSITKLKRAKEKLAEEREDFGAAVRGPITTGKTFFAEAAADIVEDATKATQILQAAQKSLQSGNLEFVLDQFGFGLTKVREGTDAVKDSISEIAQAGSTMQPVITSFAQLEAAVADPAAVLTEAERALVSFVDSAVAKLPTISSAFESASSASNSALDGLLSKLPTVGAVFDEFASKTPVSIQALTKALNQQVKDQDAFFTNIKTIISKGGADVAQQYLDLGPVEAGALAKSTAQASSARVGALEAATDAAIAANKAGQERYSAAAEAALVESARKQLDQQVKDQEAFFTNVQTIIDNGGAAIAQQLLAQGPEQGAALAAATAHASTQQVAALEASTINATIALKAGAAAVKKLAFNAYLDVGAEIAAGIAAGIRENTFRVSIAAGNSVTESMRAARAKAENTSPSKLFAREVGKPIAEGIALGINQGTPSITKAINQAVVTPGGFGAGGVASGSSVGATSSVQTSQEIHVHEAPDPMATAFRIATELGRGATR